MRKYSPFPKNGSSYRSIDPTPQTSFSLAMHYEIHPINSLIAEIQADGIIIRTAEDGLDLLGNTYYQGFERMILHAKNMSPEFFDLKNGLAGEILQKFSNYRMRLVIVGDFSAYTGKAIRDFMFESNKGKLVQFLPSLEEAVNRLSE